MTNHDCIILSGVACSDCCHSCTVLFCSSSSLLGCHIADSTLSLQQDLTLWLGTHVPCTCNNKRALMKKLYNMVSVGKCWALIKFLVYIITTHSCHRKALLFEPLLQTYPCSVQVACAEVGETKTQEIGSGCTMLTNTSIGWCSCITGNLWL